MLLETMVETVATVTAVDSLTDLIKFNRFDGFYKDFDRAIDGDCIAMI